MQQSVLVYPSLVTRIKAMLIDQLVVIAVFILAGNLFDFLSDDNSVLLRIGVFVAMVLLYEPVLTSTSYTLGQYLTGIRVRRVTDYDKKITLFSAVKRYVVKMLLGWVSFLTISFTDNKRAIHDMAGDSIVVYH